MCELIIEECLKKIKNKFDLVLIAAKIAREITIGNIKPSDINTNEKSCITAIKELEKKIKHTN